MKATRGFEIHVKGEKVHFSEGASIEDVCADHGLDAKDICDEFCLVEKKLVSGGAKKPKKG